MPKVTPIVGVTVIDRGWNTTLYAMTNPSTLDIEAGLLDDASQIAEYGFYNEFGTSRIPSRSFIRSSFDDNRRKYERMVDKALKDAQLRGKSLKGGFLKVGIVMVNDIKRRITTLRHPANADYTVARKGSSNPLIDTGTMRNAIRWRVVR